MTVALSSTHEAQKFIKANESMPPLQCFLSGLQQVMVSVCALLTVPILVSGCLNATGDDLAILRNHLVSTTFFTSGLSTLIQTGLGLRLALLQGTAFAYMASIEAHFKNETSPWQEQISTMQGSLMVSSLIPIVIGITGLVGHITRFIGPLAVSTLMILLAESQVKTILDKLELHWIGWIQCIVLVVTILYCSKWKVPLPWWKNQRLHIYYKPIIAQYPYLVAICVSYGVASLLTLLNVFSDNSPARVDRNSSVSAIQNSPWIAIPYAGQFGTPTVKLDITISFALSALTSMFESVGDYQAAAHVSREPSPPSHAINRGIIAEGIGSFVSGLLGPGVGMTTHTENIGVMGITRVASRSTMFLAGLILICLGMCTKFGAVLSSIPEPLVGGILASSMAMVVGVAVQNLQHVDMRLPRNQSIFGFAIMFGLILPRHFSKYPVATGWVFIDRLLFSLLKLKMFVGAIIAAILDSTVPGATRTERGFVTEHHSHEHSKNLKVYDLPRFLTSFLEEIPGLKYIPFLPTPFSSRHSEGTA